MPNVRNTPARRRGICPSCGRDISYTYPWERDVYEQLRRNAEGWKQFTNHKVNGVLCPTSGKPLLLPEV